MTNTNTTAAAQNPLFERIAHECLGVDTLAVRNSDSLDFHDVSVQGIQRALQAAFEAGAKSVRESR